jgi:hypothetical protein
MEDMAGNQNSEQAPFDIKPYKINLSIPVPEPHELLKINGTIIASPGNIIVIKGGAKAAKSFFVAVSIAAFILNKSIKSILGIEGNPLSGRNKIILLDTEQSLAHVHKLAKRVHRLSGFDTTIDNPNFEIYYLKELNTAERFNALRTAVNDPEAGIVFLDGAIDIIFDWNDLKESTEVRDELMQMVGKNNIALVAVIHTNKRDNNSRGHFGAMLEQKSETTIQLSKTDNIFTVSPAYTRNQPFDEIQFIIDESGLPKLVDIDSKADKAMALELKKQTNFHFALEKRSLSHTELIAEYSEVSGYATNTAKTHISEAIKKRWIFKNDSGTYSNSIFDAFI